MSDWPGWLQGVLGSGIGAAFLWGFAEVVKTIANRKLRDVTAADKLSDSALAMVERASTDAREARAEATQARRDADDARREASEARREATEARREAMVAVANMRRITTAILSPYASLEGLRAMVSDPPSSNGNGTALVSR